MNARRGFTLLELLMVVIIIGILAAIALPQFNRAAERARIAEANNALAAIRGAELRHFMANQTYTALLTDLDVDVSPTGMIGTPNFVYAIASATASNFCATATRSGAAAPPGCVAGYVVRIDKNQLYGGNCQSAAATCP